MKQKILIPVNTAFVILCLFTRASASATVLYVDINSVNPTPPYTQWAAAATNIQDAVDAALAGDLILVSNGVYRSGGRTGMGTTGTNRVTVTNAVSIQSVNGPESTIIEGSHEPDGIIGPGAVRCVYMATGGKLSGFTLTNGATTFSGGGVWCESINVVVTNCMILRNSGSSGGGIYQGTLDKCTLRGNSSHNNGGGAYRSVLNNCLLSGNSARQVGGGAWVSTLKNCLIIGNSAGGDGGGVNSSDLKNCALSGNSSETSGGGASSGTLVNCTITGNSARNSGGGTAFSTLQNCIVYFNSAPLGTNYHTGNFVHCCTTPQPSGDGNISDNPQLASISHLSASSPCRGAGSSAYASDADIDGEAWGSPPSIGCDEYHAGAATGALSAAIIAPFTSVARGYSLQFTALTEGRTAASRWEFENGVVVSNQPYIRHAWNMTGEYAVVLRAYNESNPGGVSATVTVHVVTQPIHYVAADNGNPVAPYTSWETAATNIQQAVDAATVPGALVLVTNGTYAVGGRAVVGTMTNRVTVEKLLELRSVNGPQFTVIEGRQIPGTINGHGAIRCVYLSSGSILSGFTVTNGATMTNGARPTMSRESGGGILCQSTDETVIDCVISLNSAFLSGGGAAGGTLVNCTLNGNRALGSGLFFAYGGGASSSILSNCTLSGNVAGGTVGSSGGGVNACTLNNCTVTGNSAASRGGGAYQSTLNNCILTLNSTHNGGGAYSGTLNNCTVTGNSADSQGGGAISSTMNNCKLFSNSAAYGGGAARSTLNSCTLAGNSATSRGGGIDECTLTNSIVYFNTAPEDRNYSGSSLNHCCATPLPSNGIGNITNTPDFLDQVASNFRLQSNSPCINAGNNADAVGTTDLDGRPRIVGGTVDMGAYEFQPGVSGLFLGWLEQHGLPTDGSSDYLDSDVDRMNNWQEWIAGTVPTNSSSLLRMFTPTDEVSGLNLSWQSVANRTYFLERASAIEPTLTFSSLASNIVGQATATTYTDTNALGGGPFLYRVGVQP